jgi:hypothetical protein
MRYFLAILRVCLFISTEAAAASTSPDSGIFQVIEKLIEKTLGALSNATPLGLVVFVSLTALALAAFTIHAIVKIVLRKK